MAADPAAGRRRAARDLQAAGWNAGDDWTGPERWAER